MEVELFYTRYQHGLGRMLRSDDVGEFVFGVHLDSWSTEHWAHADRVERLFKAWNVVRHDDHMDWVAFAAIVDRKRIVVGVEAVRELSGSSERDVCREIAEEINKLVGVPSSLKACIEDILERAGRR